MPDMESNTIDVAPRAGQTISHEEKEYTTIKEGLAHILVPHDIPTSTDPKMSKEDTQKQQVFYNPIQQFNRDLSVLAIKTFGEDMIQRRRTKHEKQLMKAEKKKQKILGDAAEQATDGATSKKRKLESDEQREQPGQPSSHDVPAKRRKLAENGDMGLVDMNEVEQESSSAEAQANWKPPFTILDALSATGLRALRYAQEIPYASSVTANDMSPKATESIALNIKHNKLEDKIRANTGNAIAYMYSFCDKKGFDVIDLDPYGTAAPFLDSAIQAINDEGLLCVTCTDSAIFASHGYLEKTYSQYGGLPLKGEPCHEGGLRLILHAIASSAARYGMAIEPLLSLSIDYYIRVFVRVRKSPNDVKFLAGKTMIVYHCDSGCGSWTTQFLARNKAVQNKNGNLHYKYAFAPAPSADPHCEHCGFKTHLSGPMYGGPLHNVGFIERVLAQLNEVDRETYPTIPRMEGMLRTALEEITLGVETKPQVAKDPQQLGPLIPKTDPSEIDHHPFFFIPSSISKVVHCSAPPSAALRGALRSAGFRVSMSHCKPGSIKTDASWTDIWHIMLEWVRQRAPLKNQLKKESPGYTILAKGSAHQMKPAGSKDDTATTEETHIPESKSADTEAHANGADSKIEERPSYLGQNFQVKFNEALGKDRDRGKYVRYQLAPRENWGPMSRAK